MRTKDEQLLVNQANTICERMRLSTAGIFNLSPDEYLSLLRNDSAYWGPLCHLVASMSDATLGTIIGLGLTDDKECKESHFRQTRRIIPAPGIDIFQSGHLNLVRMAIPVIVAAIYDILMTERILRDKEEQKWRDTAERSQSKNYGGYWWKPAMRNFVLKHRLRTQAT